MLPRGPESRRHWARWLAPGAAIALAPKCVLCAAAYLGLGTTLGWRGAELCGAPASATAHDLAWIAAAATLLGVGLRLARR